MKSHVRTTQISTEDYLRKDISQNKGLQTDKINELIDNFALINQHQHFRSMETDGQDTSQKSIQDPKQGNTDNTGEIMQSSNNWRDKQELKKQTHNQETFLMTRSGQIVRKLKILLLLGCRDINQNWMYMPAIHRNIVAVRTSWHASVEHIYNNTHFTLLKHRKNLLTHGTTCTNKHSCKSVTFTNN